MTGKRRANMLYDKTFFFLSKMVLIHFFLYLNHSLWCSYETFINKVCASFPHQVNKLGDNCIQNFHFGATIYGRKFSFTVTHEQSHNM